MVNTIRTVTVGIIAYNEQQYLPDLLEDLLMQFYDKKLVEVILVDGVSTDKTRQIMEDFQSKYGEDFRDVKIFQNPKRVQPSGWNIVIMNTTTEVLLRIDAHARLPYDFIENSMYCINTGEHVCGGSRENIIDENTPWKRVLLTAEQSMFGAGIASYRKKTNKKKNVGSVFHGAYRKEVIDKVGLFNEKLIRTEDNEYHYRIREAGYRICYDPVIHSYYQTRNSLKRMIKQKYSNGLWIGKTLSICPGCISLFHLVPFAFVLAIIVSTILWLFGIAWIAELLWIVYGVANIVVTFISILYTRNRSLLFLLLPTVFLLLHICYGAGTLIGLFKRS